MDVRHETLYAHKIIYQTNTELNKDRLGKSPHTLTYSTLPWIEQGHDMQL